MSVALLSNTRAILTLVGDEKLDLRPTRARARRHRAIRCASLGDHTGATALGEDGGLLGRTELGGRRDDLAERVKIARLVEERHIVVM
jgi:hypothetical protein